MSQMIKEIYMNISRNAIVMAELLRKGLEEKGYTIFIDSPTNQQFIVVENSKLSELSDHVGYGFWEKYDDAHSVVRFATSWATPPENIDKLMKLMDET